MNTANTRTSITRPGRLITTCTLALHTQEAQQLVHGVPKGSLGLFHFARRLNTLWQAARHDDPYADWMLLKIYRALHAAQTDLAHQLEQTQTVLEKETPHALQFQTSQSEQPLTLTLNFVTPYAFWSAQLVGLLDEWLRLAIASCYITRRFTAYTHERTRYWRKRLRRLWAMPQGWKATGITRHDVAANTSRYQTCCAAWGTLPAAVLQKTLRAPNAPRITKKPYSAKAQTSQPDTVSDNPAQLSPDAHGQQAEP